jgi:hypothetical protein
MATNDPKTWSAAARERYRIGSEKGQDTMRQRKAALVGIGSMKHLSAKEIVELAKKSAPRSATDEEIALSVPVWFLKGKIKVPAWIIPSDSSNAWNVVFKHETGQRIYITGKAKVKFGRDGSTEDMAVIATKKTIHRPYSELSDAERDDLATEFLKSFDVMDK